MKTKVGQKKYFLSFVEEGWRGQIVKTMGRVEVHVANERYAIEEIRWGTNDVEGFNQFRERWDFKDVTEQELNDIRKTLDEKFIIKDRA